ncbi:Amino-acid permease 2 [Erysiphe neolycopersici]|uniref:Amino-acid permease 2 n=1 Tax=Erysiphe neolycopersici TaxID=212602 RepID=A0A420HAH5_9PEZI|nr:Amino-acid permease 2 [Erysiphe neolycopersici]
MQATSRTVFAFSRDRLLPFSQVWLSVNCWTGTPLNAVWITVVLCILVNLIGLGSPIAIVGVFNVCIIFIDMSYCIPIFCKLFYGKFEPGPWHMGKFSWWVNVWAIIWTLFVSIIFLLPTIRPVNALNMNYAIAFLALILAFAWIFWIVNGKKYYSGPVHGILGDLMFSSSSEEGVQSETYEKNSNA